MKKLQLETNPQKTAQFLARVRDEITKRGIVDVLRKGIKAYPASLIMFYMTPSVNNPAAAALYAKNIFSVTRSSISRPTPRSCRWICASSSTACRSSPSS